MEDNILLQTGDKSNVCNKRITFHFKNIMQNKNSQLVDAIYALVRYLFMNAVLLRHLVCLSRKNQQRRHLNEIA